MASCQAGQTEGFYSTLGVVEEQDRIFTPPCRQQTPRDILIFIPSEYISMIKAEMKIILRGSHSVTVSRQLCAVAIQ